MASPRSSLKIRPDHLDRPAFVYVRQSTLFQVREHTASTARQYDLAQRAQDLGWSKAAITVIDQDQGLSGSSAVHRDGFQFLIAQVGLGQVGAVLSLEASRLARSCSDWYRLLEICALTDTLVIDEDGVYDPGQYADRLLLGILGAMSEAELHWLRNRLLGGKLARAEQGELRMRPPVGLVFDAARRLVYDPDEEVQQAVRLLFSLFEQTGSALAVVKHFAKHRLLFPNRLWGKTRDGELLWNPLEHGRVLAVLHNPRYAGVYVYGRTRTSTRTLPHELPRVKGRQRRVALADWPIVRHDAHPSYLSWEQFLRNQQRLDDNRTNAAKDRRGAVREGSALLQGIVLCGQCGRRMSVRYTRKGTTPSYECNQAHKQQGVRTCQFVRGDGVDAAVARLFLQAIEPAQLQVSLATLEEIETQNRQVERQWQLRLERARYEVDLARRRFLAVDPDNRLVARNLEKDWNDKLAALEQLEREQTVSPTGLAERLSPTERQRILSLAEDLPALWHASSTTATERKQLLRLLLKDVTLSKEAATIHVAVRWQTEVCTSVEVPRPPRSCDARRTPTAVVERIGALTADHTDQQIAKQLNEEGCRSGRGGLFTAKKVGWIRQVHGICSGCPAGPAACQKGQRGDGRWTAQAAAQALNVTVSTIAAWCQGKRLDGIQAVPHGPWWVLLTPEDITRLRKPVKQRWKNRSPK
jgi:DNA invertase Pin-like site-specific DNA recombinase